jgi:hypothetical protein
MPKRSNLFQRIVEALYAALRPDGGTVTESAELLERTSGIKREVDILAETSAYGTSIRVAVEVRGRSKKDDIQWIDALVGKCRDLPVDKIIAVSASGFSLAARAKAHSANIELIAASDVPHHDWPGVFHRLGIAMLSRSDRVDVQFTTKPRGCKDLGPESTMHDADGADLGTIHELVESLAARHRNWLTEQLITHFFDHYKTVADLYKTLLIELPAKPSRPMFIRTRSGATVGLAGFTVRSFSTHTVEKVPFRHVSIDSHLVSAAEVVTGQGDRVEVFATQSHANPNHVTIRHRPSPTPSRSTKKASPRAGKPPRPKAPTRNKKSLG